MHFDKEFDALMDEADKVLEWSKRAGFEFLYEEVVAKGPPFIFNADDALGTLCMVYDMYIFYLLYEEYERCAVLNNYLLNVQCRLKSQRRNKKH